VDFGPDVGPLAESIAIVPIAKVHVTRIVLVAISRFVRQSESQRRVGRELRVYRSV